MHHAASSQRRARDNFETWISDTRVIIPVADIISAVEFDHTGDYLATGDKGGRVVLFERNESVSLHKNSRPIFMSDKWTLCFLPVSRKKDANTSFIPSSSLMNQSSTISRVWKLKRKSTRSNGVDEQTPPTFYYRQTVGEISPLLNRRVS